MGRSVISKTVKVSALALALLGTSVFGGSASASFRRGRQLSCVGTGVSCVVRNMPLVAQGGTAADPVDADVQFATPWACATTSHMMLIAAAYANRDAGSTYVAGSPSANFVSLPPRNAAGSNSWIMRVNAMQNGSYWTAHPEIVKNPMGVYPAYSLQNAVYDFSPATTTLSPANCGINKWWTCQAKNTHGQSWAYGSLVNNTTLNNSYFKTDQDAGWTAMVSFSHTAVRVWTNGSTTYYDYRDPATPHKVAVNGYNYVTNLDSEYGLRINDPGSGTQRQAKIGIKYASTIVSNGTTIITVLPGNAASLPYLKYSDENAIKLMESVDELWLK